MEHTWGSEVLLRRSLDQKPFHYEGRQLIIPRQPEHNRSISGLEIKCWNSISHNWNSRFAIGSLLLHRSDAALDSSTSQCKILLNWNPPRRGGAGSYQQWSKDLPQRVRIQAIAGLQVSDLGQVREEVLQRETVMEGDGRGALEDQAHLPAMASSDCTVCTEWW